MKKIILCGLMALLLSCESSHKNNSDIDAQSTSSDGKWAISEARLFKKKNLEVLLVDILHIGTKEYYQQISDTIQNFASGSDEGWVIPDKSHLHFLLEDFQCPEGGVFKLPSLDIIFPELKFDQDGNKLWAEYLNDIKDLNGDALSRGEDGRLKYYIASALPCGKVSYGLVKDEVDSSQIEKALLNQADVDSPFTLSLEKLIRANCAAETSDNYHCTKDNALKLSFTDIRLDSEPRAGWEEYFAAALYALIIGYYPGFYDPGFYRSDFEEFLLYLNKSNLGIRNQKVLEKLAAEEEIASEAARAEITRRVVIPWGLSHNPYFESWLKETGYEFDRDQTIEMKAFECADYDLQDPKFKVYWEGVCTGI